MRSDAFGWVRTRSDAFGSVPMHLDISDICGFFGISLTFLHILRRFQMRLNICGHVRTCLHVFGFIQMRPDALA